MCHIIPNIRLLQLAALCHVRFGRLIIFPGDVDEFRLPVTVPALKMDWCPSPSYAGKVTWEIDK